ncbi:hypothetical protein DD769_08105, partial [Helicobacter pylori]
MKLMLAPIIPTIKKAKIFCLGLAKPKSLKTKKPMGNCPFTLSKLSAGTMGNCPFTLSKLSAGTI